MRLATPTLELVLEAGFYVIGASARWSEGNASIGFLVEVQPDVGTEGFPGELPPETHSAQRMVMSLMPMR